MSMLTVKVTEVNNYPVMDNPIYYPINEEMKNKILDASSKFNPTWESIVLLGDNVLPVFTEDKVKCIDGILELFSVDEIPSLPTDPDNVNADEAIFVSETEIHVNQNDFWITMDIIDEDTDDISIASSMMIPISVFDKSSQVNKLLTSGLF